VNFHGKGRAHTDGLASQRRDGGEGGRIGE
jgi:hypothetical protein